MMQLITLGTIQDTVFACSNTNSMIVVVITIYLLPCLCSGGVGM